jgi:RING-variant domain
MDISSQVPDNNNEEIQVYTFSQNKKHSKVAPYTNSLSIQLESEDITCRICLETDQAIKNFIRPCKCSGSIKYVHEGCLKTWLMSLGKDLDSSKCELCSTKFLMSFRILRKCSPKNSCKTGAAHCLFIPILLIVMLILFLVVYLLIEKYFHSKSSGDQQAYIIALSLTCIVAGSIIVVLIFNSIKEACYLPKLEEWTILSQDIPDEQDKEIGDEEFAKLEEMRKKMTVLPSTFKIRGKRVHLTDFRTNMTPVHQNRRAQAFSPRFFTPVANVNSNGLNPFNDSYFTFKNLENHSKSSSISGLLKD